MAKRHQFPEDHEKPSRFWVNLHDKVIWGVFPGPSVHSYIWTPDVVYFSDDRHVVKESVSRSVPKRPKEIRGHGEPEKDTWSEVA